MKNKINWKDRYKTLLCIFHHLMENIRKYEKYVDVKTDVEIEKAKRKNIYIINEDGEKKIKPIPILNGEEAQRVAKEELNKELVDLYLLIEAHIEQNNLEHLVEERIQRFSEKAKE